MAIIFLQYKHLRYMMCCASERFNKTSRAGFYTVHLAAIRSTWCYEKKFGSRTSQNNTQRRAVSLRQITGNDA